MKTRYRIVVDNYSGYEAQFRYWWMPIWFQCFWTNTSATKEAAKKLIENHQAHVVWED